MSKSPLTSLFSLNTGTGIPIYRQLMDQIKQAIRMDLLQQNEQLPSVRSLASALQINPMTISKAFAQLEIENVLVRKRGVGMLVAKQQQGKALDVKIEQQLSQFIASARTENMDDESILTLVQQYLSLHSAEYKQ